MFESEASMSYVWISMHSKLAIMAEGNQLNRADLEEDWSCLSERLLRLLLQGKRLYVPCTEKAIIGQNMVLAADLH